MAKPVEKVKPEDGKAPEVGAPPKPKEKPRTLVAARAQKNLVGEPMKQNGGAQARGKIAFEGDAIRELRRSVYCGCAAALV